MRVLWASHVIPYPPKSGVHLRCYNLLRAVASRHDVDLIAFIQEQWLKIFYSSRTEGLADCRRELSRVCRSVTLLPIESELRRGGKLRTAFEGLVCPLSYTTRWLQGAVAREVFAAAARDRYDLVHLDTIGLGPYRRLFSATPATLGHHNVESHMLLRRATTEADVLKRAYFRYEGRRVARYEATTAKDYAAHVTCSELDSDRLRAVTGPANVRAVRAIPNGVDIEYFRRTGRAQVDPRSIIFVGSLNWYPNVDAVLFLLKEIWPLVKTLVPEVRLDIVGSAPPRNVVELAAASKDVRVHGYVDDVRPLMEAAAVYVCPIRGGGGTKLKLLDAFAMQNCVVAHPVACEGIDVTDGRNVELAETAEEFAAAIHRLLADPAVRASMGRAARDLVVQHYSFAKIGRQLCEVFESAASGGPLPQGAQR